MPAFAYDPNNSNKNGKLVTGTQATRKCLLFSESWNQITAQILILTETQRRKNRYTQSVNRLIDSIWLLDYPVSNINSLIFT